MGCCRLRSQLSDPQGFEFILFFLKGCTRKTRIIDVVYNASNNELVRTKTLVKNCIVLVDSTPYRQWYEAHYALPLGRKKGAKLVRGGCVGSSRLLGRGEAALLEESGSVGEHGVVSEALHKGLPVAAF